VASCDRMVPIFLFFLCFFLLAFFVFCFVSCFVLKELTSRWLFLVLGGWGIPSLVGLLGHYASRFGVFSGVCDWGLGAVGAVGVIRGFALLSTWC